MSATVSEAELRRRCEQLARPLYAGLDGVQTFDRVERVRVRLDALRDDDTRVDRELLEILTVFHGVADRLGPLGPGARFDLFLGALGLTELRRLQVRKGLRRLENSPQTTEERLLHDAVLLEQAGVAAAVSRLMTAGRKRLPARRAVESLDPGPDPRRFRTRAGAEWARREHDRTRRWIEELRSHFAG